jgi:hypothetical protein
MACLLEPALHFLLYYHWVLDLAENDRRVPLLQLKLLVHYLERSENTQTEHSIVTKDPSKHDSHDDSILNFANIMSQEVHADDDPRIDAEAKQYSEIACSLCRAEDMNIDLLNEPE